jgi:phosphoribosylaminoimidazole carboxylase (NCAIR synthetase)
MKRISIVGGSHSEIPLIYAAKRLGYQVFTSGNRPRDIGHRLADGFENCDYSDPAAILSVAPNSALVQFVLAATTSLH